MNINGTIILELIGLLVVGYVLVEGIVYIFFYKIPIVRSQTISRRIDVCGKQRQLVIEEEKLLDETRQLNKKRRNRNGKHTNDKN